MKKTTFFKEKKWRRINPYICKFCGKKRLSFIYKKSKVGVCSKCFFLKSRTKWKLIKNKVY